jgi:hypothetical protein
MVTPLIVPALSPDEQTSGVRVTSSIRPNSTKAASVPTRVRRLAASLRLTCRVEKAKQDFLELTQLPPPAECEQRPGARSPIRATKAREGSVDKLSLLEVDARQLRAPTGGPPSTRTTVALGVLLANQEAKLKGFLEWDNRTITCSRERT